MLKSTNSNLKSLQQTKLLVKFGKICKKANDDEKFMLRLRKLYLQSSNKLQTIQQIFINEYGCNFSSEESETLLRWFKAWISKDGRRKSFTLEEKLLLAKKQQMLCNICQKELRPTSSDMHVDHIIPWQLVGDELEDNYQILCPDCNLEKSCRLTYMFEKEIGIK